jgi:hypothetical protein
MTQQQPSIFDIPKPKRKEYSVVVHEVTSDEYCLQPVTFRDKQGEIISRQTCYNSLEISSCDICGLPTCIPCFSYIEEDRWDICESCAELSKADREQVRAFRLKLNEL